LIDARRAGDSEKSIVIDSAEKLENAVWKERLAFAQARRSYAAMSDLTREGADKRYEGLVKQVQELVTKPSGAPRVAVNHSFGMLGTIGLTWTSLMTTLHHPMFVPLAIALTIAGSFVMWQAVTWLAGQWNLPNRAWQFGFVVFWILPSVLIDMLLLFRGRLRYDS